MEDDSELVAVLLDVPERRVGEILALLGSAGIDVDHRRRDGAILVRPIDEASARRLLHEIDLESDEEPTPEPEPTVVWSRRGMEALALVAAACLLVFWSSHLSGASPTRERLLQHGAISWSLVEAGEVWRLFTAVFLHFGGAHLLSNLLTLALVGPPLAHHLGSSRFLIVFLSSGILGNVASHLLFPTMGLKAGASGAVAGVLGALAGQTLRREFRGRLRRWQVLGALAAVYAILVGAGPGRDNVAHAGGLIAGLVLGRLLPPASTPPENQGQHAT